MKPYTALVAFAIVLISIVGCGGGSGGSSSGGTGGNGTGVATVAVSASNANPTGFAFQTPVTVKSGQMVKWNNLTAATHGITWDSQTPSTSPAPPAKVDLFAGGTMSQTTTMPTVTTQTTYNYHCTVHGPQMAGQIIVNP
ncbi:MAG TPA: plastocyanin/azurin family copper-binding protein [Capsulimonadaceae bacterium]|nr:plastocyanin/azurin family copper-binding protein [Capsulimonadaceae bacterium]